MIDATDARPTPSTSGSSTVRFFIATEPGAELGYAAIEAILHDDRAEIAGTAFERIDPDRLRAARPDVLLSAAHPFLIRAPERAVARLGAVGLHPALLPRYRGSYPLWWALRNGERETGLTLYHLVSAIDAGPVIGQRHEPILPGDTFASLYSRVATDVAPLLRDLVTAILATGRIPEGEPQDERLATVVRTPGLVPRVAYRGWWSVRRRVVSSPRVP